MEIRFQEIIDADGKPLFCDKIISDLPLDVLKNERGEANPCLVMIKILQACPGAFNDANG